MKNGFLRYAVDGDPRRIVRVGAATQAERALLVRLFRQRA